MNNDKLIGQFRLQLNGVLTCFDMCGLGVFIPQAQAEITRLALLLHEGLNGEPVILDGKIIYDHKN